MPNLTDRLLIISCGATKAPDPQPPHLLYTGGYFRACLATALAVTQGRRDRVLILSALYGLLRLDGPPLPPYDLRLGQPGTVTVVTVRRQAAELGVTADPVTTLAAGDYAGLCRQVWADVNTPLAGLGIGERLGAMKRWRAALAGLSEPSQSPGSETARTLEVPHNAG